MHKKTFGHIAFSSAPIGSLGIYRSFHPMCHTVFLYIKIDESLFASVPEGHIFFAQYTDLIEFEWLT